MYKKESGSDFVQKRNPRGYETFLIFYIVLIIIPAIIISSGQRAWVNILLSLGLILLMLFYYFDKTYATSVAWGMTSVYKSAEQERYFIDYHRMHLWKECDIALSFDIKPFLKNKIKEMAVMGKLGSKMRILLLDPQSKYVELVEKASGMKKGEYAYYALQVQNFMMRVNQAQTEDVVIDIQVKYYDDMPMDNILRAYDVLFAYDNKHSAENNYLSYSYEYGFNGYNFYKALFDEKWNNEAFSYEKEITSDMVNNYRYFADNDNVYYDV